MHPGIRHPALSFLHRRDETFHLLQFQLEPEHTPLFQHAFYLKLSPQQLGQLRTDRQLLSRGRAGRERRRRCR